MPLASMLRIYCMQNWFSFAYRQMDDTHYEIESIRRLAGFGSVTETLSDETTRNGQTITEKSVVAVVLSVLFYLQKGISISFFCLIMPQNSRWQMEISVMRYLPK